MGLSRAGSVSYLPIALLSFILAFARCRALIAKPCEPFCTKSFKLTSLASEGVVLPDPTAVPPVVGSRLAYFNNVYYDNKKFGAILASCTVVTVTPEGLLDFCNIDFVSDADEGYFGTISTQGLIRSVDPSVSYLAITGGTRGYRSASGQIKVTVANSTIAWDVALKEKPPCGK